MGLRVGTAVSGAVELGRNAAGQICSGIVWLERGARKEVMALAVRSREIVAAYCYGQLDWKCVDA